MRPVSMEVAVVNTPVVLLHGLRQCDKTTLARSDKHELWLHQFS
jgi:hypothetical protein